MTKTVRESRPRKAWALPPVRPSIAFYRGQNVFNLQGHFPKQSCFLLCGGPSVNDLDLSALKQPGILVAAINNAPRTFRPHIWFHGDAVDHFLASAYLDPAIMKIVPTCCRSSFVFDSVKWQLTTKRLNADVPNVYFYDLVARPWQAQNWLQSDRVIWGDAGKGSEDVRSTMFAAIRILYELGVDTIYLLGCDFHMDPAKPYHFDESKSKGAASWNNHAYEVMAGRFAQLADPFKRAGLTIFNCNPKSSLKVFPMIDFDIAVMQAQERFGVWVSDEKTRGLYTSSKPDRVFSSYGKIGDLIYSLPAIRALGGGVIELVHRPRGGDFYRPEQQLASVGPLLRSQKYIRDVRLAPAATGIDLDAFRGARRHPTLAGAIAVGVGADPSCIHERWLFDVPPKAISPVIVNRSPRYRNDLFPWTEVLKKYGDRVTFIGFDHEYDDFCKRFGPVGRYKCAGVWEMAQVISGCDLFIGNQSSAYAIAEGMKKRTIQETSVQVPDCIFERPSATYWRCGPLVLPDI